MTKSKIPILCFSFQKKLALLYLESLFMDKKYLYFPQDNESNLD